jgi:hypothetical protein
MAKLIICSSYHYVQWGGLGDHYCPTPKTNYSSSALKCLFASISNHMANKVNWSLGWPYLVYICCQSTVSRAFLLIAIYPDWKSDRCQYPETIFVSKDRKAVPKNHSFGITSYALPEKNRFPLAKSTAPVATGSIREVRSSGFICPSPSIRTTTSKFRSAAHAYPVITAPPHPWLISCSIRNRSALP